MFLNRGIDLYEIEHYLNTTENDILDPMLLDNITEGAKMLISHISQNNKIFIQIDCDADGYTSAATLINYLYCLFPAFVQNNISYRVHSGKEHGVIVDTVPEDTKLVILPDAGSNQYDEHAQLKEKGIDVLVLDHHETEQESPNACIINNQLCQYPNKSLSGVGVVFKFCSYLDILLNTNYASNYIDLVALGLISDVMDLRSFETAYLVKQGLAQIRNPYFKTMVDKQSFVMKDIVTPIGVAFYVTPYINATIRMGSEQEKLTLFESMLDFKGYTLVPSTKRGCAGQTEILAEQACRNCTNIKNKQTIARDTSLEIIEQIIEDKQLLKNKILAIKLSKDLNINSTLTGLIANQLMGKYQRPVLLLRETKENDKIFWSGSARGYDKSSFKNFKDFVQKSNLTQFAEGHQNAFGTSIADDDFYQFIDYSNNELAQFDFSPSYRVDFIYSADNIISKDILDISDLNNIWGQGIEEPLIAIENIKITKDNISLMGKGTLKITLPNGISLIKFRSSNEEYEQLYSELGCVNINVIGRCNKNIWNGIISPQVLITDYEIIGKTEYYF